MSTDDARPFWETELKQWAPWLGANFFGVLNCNRTVVRHMVQQRYARIVTIVSDAGRFGEPNLAVYSGSSTGVAGFMRAIARAVGHAGVKANCVSLAAMRTRATADATADPALLEQLLRRYAIGRLGAPSDAANLVLYLASDAAAWISGQTYPVNRGSAMAV